MKLDRDRLRGTPDDRRAFRHFLEGVEIIRPQQCLSHSALVACNTGEQREAGSHR